MSSTLVNEHFENVSKSIKLTLNQTDPHRDCIFCKNTAHDGTIYVQQHQILAYADDIDIIGKTEGTVWRIFESLEKEAKKPDFK